MKRYHIRKYSLVWWANQVGVQLAIVAIIVLLILNSFYFTNAEAADILDSKPDTVETVTAEAAEAITLEELVNNSYYECVPLDKELQFYTSITAESYGVPIGLVYGLINKESRFNINASGDSGRSVGLMQIQPRWQKARMEKLDITDAAEPYSNILLGIDILAELLQQYNSVEEALIVYNYGASAAKKCCFDKGIYSNDYTRDIIRYAEDFPIELY